MSATLTDVRPAAAGSWMRRFRHPSGIPVTTLATAGTALAGAAAGALLARILGPQGRGELAGVLLWAGVLDILSDFGLNSAFAHYAERLDRSSLIGSATVLGLAHGLILVFAFSAVAWTGLLPLWPHEALGVVIAALGLPLDRASAYLLQIHLGSGRVWAVALTRLWGAACYACVIAAAGLAHLLTVPVCVGLYVLSHLLTAAAAFWLTARYEHLGWRFQRAVAVQLYRYGARNVLASLASNANLRLDQALMNFMLLPVQLGLYVVAVGLSNCLVPLYNAVSLVVTARVATSRSLVGARRAGLRPLAISIAIWAPATLAGAVSAQWLVPLIFGGSYGGAVAVARVLFVASGFQGCNGVLGNAMRALGRPGLTAIAELAGLAVTVALLLTLLPVLGIMGAGIASLAAYATVFCAQFLMFRRATAPARGHALA